MLKLNRQLVPVTIDQMMLLLNPVSLGGVLIKVFHFVNKFVMLKVLFILNFVKSLFLVRIKN